MKIINRQDVKTEHTWDLNKLYTDPEAWEVELRSAESELESLSISPSNFVSNKESFESTIRSFLALSQKIEKLYCYTALLSDEDTANSKNFGLKGLALSLYTKFSAASSFIRPAIISLDTDTLNSYLDDGNADLHRMITEIARYKPHTLADSEELLLAEGGEVFRSNQLAFSQLTNADLTFESVEVDGKPEPLTQGTFISFLKNQNRQVRESAWVNFYNTFSNHKNCLSTVLASEIKKNCYLARVRKFESPRSQALFSYNIPSAVYDSLVNSVNETLAPLNNYYRLRKEVLNLEQLELYDSYVPIVEDPKINISYDKACDILAEACLPLGEEYSQTLFHGLTKGRWVDRYENKGKRSGAYAMPCYSSDPYMLMNYRDTELGQLFTLAHEAGHAMHTHYSKENQSFQDYSYTIFVAEVASTLNEQLLLDYLKKEHASDQVMLKYLLNHQIEDIKATFYRQTMFAEFEMKTHQDGQAGVPLTLDYFRQTYRGLLEKYFGEAMNINPLGELECLRIPHFFSAFYVYQYATGLSAAVSLANPIIDTNKEARDRYLNFLKSGCSKYSLDLLRDAGVDLEQSTPFEEVAQLFESRLKQLEAIYSQDKA